MELPIDHPTQTHVRNKTTARIGRLHTVLGWEEPSVDGACGAAYVTVARCVAQRIL